MKEDAGKNQQKTEHNPEQAAAEISQDLTKAHKETQAEQMDRRHKTVAQKVQQKAISALAALAPEDMTANEARQLLKTAQEIERRITEGRRDPERQLEEVQALFESVWKAVKGG